MRNLRITVAETSGVAGKPPRAVAQAYLIRQPNGDYAIVPVGRMQERIGMALGPEPGSSLWGLVAHAAEWIAYEEDKAAISPKRAKAC
jgi:hypothetical protein